MAYLQKHGILGKNLTPVKSVVNDFRVMKTWKFMFEHTLAKNLSNAHFVRKSLTIHLIDSSIKGKFSTVKIKLAT